MDKERLEKLILSCKPAVLRAKVWIVRKLLKKMKLLKTCKDPALKEKKLKKASRVLEEIVIINRLKVFDVTSFALRTKNYVEALQTPSNERLHALAVLAKFNDVSNKVTKLRKKFKNEAELLSLLDSLEEKRKSRVKRKAVKKKTEKKGEKPVKKKKKSEVKANLQKDSVTTNGEAKNKNKVKFKNLANKSKIQGEKNHNPKPKPKSKISENNKTQVKKVSSEPITDDERKNEINIVQVRCDNKEDSKISSADVNEEKIDDPFFVGKKVIKPKFVNTEDDEMDDSENEGAKPVENLRQRGKDSLWKMKDSKESWNSTNKAVSNKKPEKRKSGVKPTTQVEELHPSWAAKKSVQPIIQPFQGKKIKFDD